MLQGKSILVVMLLAALSASGCSRSSDKEEKDENSSTSGGVSHYLPFVSPGYSSSGSTPAGVNEARPVRRFSDDVGTGSRANITARGGSFFGFGTGS